LPRVKYRNRNALRIFKHVIVAESQHSVSARLEVLGPRTILRSSFRVLATIGLNHQHSFEAAEIGDKSADRILTSELVAGESPATRDRPRTRLCIGLRRPQLPRTL
jgi:hypothetical protein